MTVTVDAVIYYRVFNPIMATNNVEDFRHSTHLLGATTLRNVLGHVVYSNVPSYWSNLVLVVVVVVMVVEAPRIGDKLQGHC